MKRTGWIQIISQTGARSGRLAQLVFFGIASGALIFSAGCNSEKTAQSVPDNSQFSDGQVTPSIAKTETSSVSASKTNAETSPAEKSSQLSADASPEEVCRQFMDFLRSGKRISAENLLTRGALTVTTKAGLQLEPMGGPTAVYEIGDACYATIKNKLAQVDCEIVEQVDGQEIRTSLTWLVRKQNLGWRISGLMVAIESGGMKDLLSFENAEDVEKIKSLAAGEMGDDLETRQAEAPSKNSLK